MSTNDLKNVGLKVTLPRIKILNILTECDNDNNCHKTAEDIHKELLNSGEELGLATVYRVLAQFEEAGLITRHNFDGGQSVFELNEGDDHDHMVCISCGNIQEFNDDVILARQKAVAKKYNFEIKEQKIILYGLCQSCH